MILKSGEFDLRKYEVVRTQFFASANMTSVSISQSGIRFSSGCIRKFVQTEYVELQVHPYTKQIAVLPCLEQHKNKMCWARIYADSISVRLISGSAFLSTLYELFDWDPDKRYRLRGEIIRDENSAIALFDTNMPEIFTSRYEMTMPWATGFGEDYCNYKNSQLPEVPTRNTFSEYSNEPELQPTAQENAVDNVRVLIEKMQKGGRYSDAVTDILS